MDRLIARIVAACALSIAASCGGGGGDGGTPDSPPTTPVTPLPQGQLDRAYGKEGKAVPPLSVYTEMKVDPAGNAYVGSTLNNVTVKFTALGTPDAGFGSAGQVPLPIAAIAFDPGGDLYAAVGQFITERVARFDGTGRPVPGFGDARLDMVEPTHVHVVLRDATGNVFAVAGPLNRAAAFHLVVVKFDASGRPVPSFGAGGALLVPVEAVLGTAIDAKLDSRGDLIIVGKEGVRPGIAPSPLERVFAVKVDSAGTLVSSYGVDGRWRGERCAGSLGPAMDLDASDHAYIVDTCLRDGVARPRIVKLDSAGLPVAAFARMGTKEDIFEDVPNKTSGAGAVLVDPAGNVYVAGYIGDCADLAIAKIDPAGRLVPAFGTGGRALYELGGDDVPRKIAMDGAGRLYVGVLSPPCISTRPGTIHPFAVVRLKP